jgi:toxin CptA
LFSHYPFMSIAVSAVVQPSRILLMMVGAMSALCAATGMLAGLGQFGELAEGPRFIICISGFFLAFFGFYHGVRRRKPIHIDITGAGQIRIWALSANEPCTKTNGPHVNADGMTVRLLESSTIWPQLLLLRLQTEGGETIDLPILRDSVSPQCFRALSVACRWISQNGNAQNWDNF